MRMLVRHAVTIGRFVLVAVDAVGGTAVDVSSIGIWIGRGAQRRVMVARMVVVRVLDAGWLLRMSTSSGPGSIGRSYIGPSGLRNVGNDGISSTELRPFGRVPIHMSFQEIPSNKGPLAIRIFASEDLLGIMIQLMTIAM
jgi:hypothetical protein